MKRALRRFYAVTALILGVGALVTLSLLQPVVGTRADFSIFNARWNGASGMAARLYGEDAFLPGFSVRLDDEGVTIVRSSFADFDLDPRAASLVLLGPATAPTAEEAAWLRAFVRGGGRVMVADDFGAGNAFLEAMGAHSRFAGEPVLDLGYARRPEFAVAQDLAPHPVTAGVREVVLDRPTLLELGPSAVALGRTSPSSWTDADGDRLPDADEPLGPFPWLAAEPVGEGEVLLLADPSVLINGMLPVGDNAAFLTGVVRWLAEGERGVLVDESHAAYQDALKLAGTRLRSMPEGLRAALALGAAALFLALALGGAPRRLRVAEPVRRLAARLLPAPPPERDLVKQARERHPDWDENALRRILSAGGKP